MILSTHDLDFEKIHKSIFTRDKAKNKSLEVLSRTNQALKTGLVFSICV